MSESKKQRRRPLYRALFLDVLFNPRARPAFIYALVMIGIGAALYHWLEGWSWLDATYFVVITLTTIGYGDFAPTQPITKVITIIYALNGVILLLVLFDVVRTVRGWEVGRASKEDDAGQDR
jgi:hypothetical protein